MRLQGKSCVITGAGRGIGKAIGARRGSGGGNVVLADINEGEAKAAAQEVGAKSASNGHGKAIGAYVDVGNRATVAKLISQTVSEWGKLDIMFNNAGLNKIQRF